MSNTRCITVYTSPWLHVHTITCLQNSIQNTYKHIYVIYIQYYTCTTKIHIAVQTVSLSLWVWSACFSRSYLGVVGLSRAIAGRGRGRLMLAGRPTATATAPVLGWSLPSSSSSSSSVVTVTGGATLAATSLTLACGRRHVKPVWRVTALRGLLEKGEVKYATTVKSILA